MGAPIYGRGREAHRLMHEFAREALVPGQEFSTQDAVEWFARCYPKFDQNTVEKHVRGMATNDPEHRKHHPQIRPNGGWDLFYKVGPNCYRLWDEMRDPAPLYGPESRQANPRGQLSSRGDRIYGKTTRDLLHEFAEQTLEPGREFSPKDAVRWFAVNYPRVVPRTVEMRVQAMAVNNRAWREFMKLSEPDERWDLFFKVDGKTFRLWDKENDPAPIYASCDDVGAGADADATDEGEDDDEEEQEEQEAETSRQTAEEFAREKDLQNYLAENLGALEPGLALHPDGVEHPAGRKSIDILARDGGGGFVVIELKVSRGHDRATGQIAYYIAWVKRNLAEGKPVRGIIVASRITESLKLAASELPSVSLFEYSLSFSVRPVRD